MELDVIEELTLEPTGTPEVTAADVDFNKRQDDTLARLTAEKMGTEAPAKPEPVVEKPARPAKEAAAQPDKAAPVKDEPAPAKALTEADIRRLIDEGVAAKLAAQQTPAEKKADPRPMLKEDRFTTHEEWEQADTEWLARQLAGATTSLETKLATDAEKAQQEEAAFNSRRTSWEEAEKEAATKIPNYEALKTEAASMEFSKSALDLILDQGKLGPFFIKYYVENKSEWSEVVKMSEADMKAELRAIGRELKRGQAAVTAPVTPPKVSKAREPLQTVSGQGAPGSQGDEGDDFNARQERTLAAARRNRLGQFT